MAARGQKKKGKMGQAMKMGAKLKKIPGASDMAGNLAGEMGLPEELGDMANMAGNIGGALKMGRKGFGSLGNGLDMIEGEDISLPGQKGFGSMGNGLDMIGGKKKKKPGFFGKLFKFGGMIKNIPGVSDLAGDLAGEMGLPEGMGELAGDLADAVGEMGDEMPDMDGMQGGLKKVGKMGKMAGKMGKMAGKMSDGMSLPEDMGEMSDMVGDVGGALKMGRKGFGSLGNGLDMIEGEDISLPGRKGFGSMGNGLDMIGGKKKKKPGFFGKLFKFGGMIKNIPGVSDLAGDLAGELGLPEELGEFADAVGEIGDEMPDMEGMRDGLKMAGKMGKMAGKMGKMSGGMSLPEDMGDAAEIMDDAMDMAGKLKKKSPGGMGDRLPKLPGGHAVGRNGNGHNLPHNGMTQAGVSYAIPNQTRPKLPAPKSNGMRNHHADKFSEMMTDPLDDPLDELPSDEYENVPQDLWHDALWTRSKDAADSCIREQTQNGIYLIRYSDDHQAVLVAHVPAKRLCKFKIKKTMDNQVYIRENEDFSTGEHLLAYYKCHDLPGYSTPLTKSYRRV